jgi:cobyrinic acid a,c-diamide synthase
MQTSDFPPSHLPPGILISAPASGTGKTTVTLGLLAAFRAQGLCVQPFKSGPDYIDPAFHAAAAGRVSVNLDSWSMTEARIRRLALQGQGADLIVAEGSMGLFDGVAIAGEAGNGASADVAAMMGWPVIVVLDVSGQAQTAAAVAYGMAQFRKGLNVAGVILNKVASPRHEALIRVGMEAAGLRVLGALPRKAEISLPERHLGLVQAEELPRLEAILAEAAAFVTAHCDLDAIRAVACMTHGANSGARSRPRFLHRASGSLWRGMQRFLLCIRIFWRIGGRKGRRSCRSRPWPTKRLTLLRQCAGCRGAILNCMPDV